MVLFDNFRGDQIFMNFVRFLISMIIYKVLYVWCFIYNPKFL